MPGRHRGIGMNRPKKKKPVATEVAQEVEPEPVLAAEPLPVAPPPPSPAAMKRREAQANYKQALTIATGLGKAFRAADKKFSIAMAAYEKAMPSLEKKLKKTLRSTAWHARSCMYSISRSLASKESI